MIDRLNRVAGYYRDQIEVKGFALRHSVDFAELERITPSLLLDKDDKPAAVTPHFSTAQNTFFWSQAFWVGIWKDEECVGTVACKRQELGRENLASYSRRYWRQTYQPGSDVEVDLAQDQKRYIEQMTGTLVYCGEYRIHSDYQKTGLGVLLADYIKPTTWLYWPDVDHFYIYMEKPDVRRGLLAAIGLEHQIENVLRWNSCPSQAQPDYYFAAIAQAGFQDWLDDHFRAQGALGPKSGKSGGSVWG
ncbi:MAG: hypothetical protein AAF468_22265 [Pseudomonadota bacterium]